jgi:hypothetical protein
MRDVPAVPDMEGRAGGGKLRPYMRTEGIVILQMWLRPFDIVQEELRCPIE